MWCQNILECNLEINEVKNVKIIRAQKCQELNLKMDTFLNYNNPADAKIMRWFLAQIDFMKFIVDLD